MTRLLDVNVPDIGDYQNVPVIEVLVKAGDTLQALKRPLENLQLLLPVLLSNRRPIQKIEMLRFLSKQIQMILGELEILEVHYSSLQMVRLLINRLE